MAASNRVGNLLGEGRGAEARVAAGTAWALVMGSSTAVACLFLAFRRPIASSFVVNDEPVAALTASLMPWTVLYSWLAAAGPGWSQQIFYGLGARLRVPATINFLSMYGVGVPVGALLAFRGDLGVYLGIYM